jgi:ATP-dependent DNA ligase I
MTYFEELANLFSKLEKESKRLKKTYLISQFLKILDEKEYEYVIRFLTGQLFFPWEEKILGVKDKLVFKALSQISGESQKKIENLYTKLGDIGEVIETTLKKSKFQSFFKKKLTIEEVFKKIISLAEYEGEKSIEKKLNTLKGLLSNSNPKEAKYIAKIILNELRVGVAEGIIRDALVWNFLPKPVGIFGICEKCGQVVFLQDNCLNCGFPMDKEYSHQVFLFEKKLEDKVIKVKDEELEKILKENIDKEYLIFSTKEKAQEFYNLEVELMELNYSKLVDYGEIARLLKNNRKNFFKIKVRLFRPIRVMLAQKVKNIKEGLETVGSPALVEYKYDGFRVQIHNKEGEIRIYTRRLEEVTKQFPDLVDLVKKHIKAKNYIIEGEVIGFKDGKPLPFQYLSRRIKRKYNILELAKEIPIKANLFDIVFLEDELFNKTQEERRKLLKTLLKENERIVLSKALISGDEKEIKKFYDQSLMEGQEGIMMKNLKAPYKPGKRVGYMVKLKPTLENLDLVIVAAEWGEGKRAGWLTSYYIAAFDEKNQELVEIGKVSTGVKEKDTSGVTFEELTNLLKPLIIKEEGKKVLVQPKVVVEVAYEEIQESPTYKSGFALRFPRIVRLRPDKGVEDIDSIERIKRIAELQKREKVEKELGIIDL